MPVGWIARRGGKPDIAISKADIECPVTIYSITNTKTEYYQKLCIVTVLRS